MIQDTNFKSIEGDVITYEREQTFVKRDRTPVILIIDSLNFIQGKYTLVSC